MCGLAGLMGESGYPVRRTVDLAAAMASTLVHRGPDDADVWGDSEVPVALGFRRLAVVDLSPAGRQPMMSASGRWVIAFNGEVYNAPEIRRRLEARGEAPRFRGHSDTETMLATIEAQGLDEALSQFIGMFAFALWDRVERVMHLVRDRFGVKPMYYAWARGALVFGSELRALLQHPGVERVVDRSAVAGFLRHNYVPGPASILRDVRKLPPGTVLSQPFGRGEVCRPRAYWSARSLVEGGLAAADPLTDGEAVDQLDALLRDAVGIRMVADVPLGAFLSGGVDSSLVTAIMQSRSGVPIRTFSIGFQERGFDESDHARAVADHLRTDHTELLVTAREALAIVPDLCHLYDEPFADSSQIPTALVAQLARRHVTVALSGDGGDEIFGGYDRYVWFTSFLRALGPLPLPVRRALVRLIGGVGPNRLARLHAGVASLLPPHLRVGNLAGKLEKIARMASAESEDLMYRGLLSHLDDPALLLPGAVEPRTTLTDPAQWPRVEDPGLRAMYLDIMTYLPDDILVKVDRASMAFSLEAREPLLDHRLLELSCRLAADQRIRGRTGKWVLRRVLERYLPATLFARPKMGFGIPLGEWLRGPLRDWGEALLAESRIRSEGLLAVGAVRRLWSEHVSGTRNHQYLLWNILMLQAWLEAFANAVSQPARTPRVPLSPSAVG